MTEISRRHLMQAGAGLLAVTGGAAAVGQIGQAVAGETKVGRNEVRARFALAPDRLFFNAANLCPTFKAAIAAETAESAALQANPSQEFRDRYLGMVATVHTRIARNINARPEAIALTRNCSESNTNISRGMRLKAGDEIIVGKENHASNLKWWRRRESTEGVIVKVAQVPDEPRNVQEVLDSYISLVSSRTKVIALSHQTNVGGIIAPAAEIGRFARSRNVWLHLDCAQTFGWMKLDMTALSCDSMAASTHKWMMGPMGGGVLYVRPERIEELDPLILSTALYRTGPAEAVSGQAFESLGQRPDAMIPGLLAALDERDLLGGDEAIEHLVRANAVRMRQKLSAKGIKVIGSGDPLLWGPVIAADVGGLPDRAKQLYDSKKLAASTTGIGGKQFLRISPHVYNTADELDQVAAFVA